VVEHVLVEEVGFVEEEDGVDACGAELVDVLADLVEDRRRRGTRAPAQREAELAVEVTAAERGVVAVGETDPASGRRCRSERRTQVLPTPGSPVSRMCSWSWQASTRRSTRRSRDAGTQRSSSRISFEKGGDANPK
jgi:hypothetical protein